MTQKRQNEFAIRGVVVDDEDTSHGRNPGNLCRASKLRRIRRATVRLTRYSRKHSPARDPKHIPDLTTKSVKLSLLRRVPLPFRLLCEAGGSRRSADSDNPGVVLLCNPSHC